MSDAAGMADAVPDLTADALSDRAIALLGYQRTKQISRRARRAHEAGDPAPLAAEVAGRREAIFAGAVAEVFAEYLPLRDILLAEGLRPQHVVDIGCGLGINDVFLARDFAPRFTLIDIESTERQFHGWAAEGAGYASLADAMALLVSNGQPADRITLLNPRRDPDALSGIRGDLVTSLYSCGFHYPVDPYLDLFLATMSDGGAVVLDLRKRYLRARGAPLQRLLEAGEATLVYDGPKSQRLILRRA